MDKFALREVSEETFRTENLGRRGEEADVVRNWVFIVNDWVAEWWRKGAGGNRRAISERLA